MLRLGLNPYGLTYSLGLQAHGAPRANPNPGGLEGFIETAVGIGARSIELHHGWLTDMSANELADLKQRLEGLGLEPIVSSGLPHEPIGACVPTAAALGAKTIRLALTRILCGDRAELGDGWAKLVTEVREGIGDYAARAAAEGIWIAIENHQDFGSRELVNMCEEAGDNVGICYDIANSFPVVESPLAFTRVVAPKVRHVHLKDYNVQFTDEGYRLVRCAVGDGAVPIAEIVEMLGQHHDGLTASIEIAALEARHVRFLRPEWWKFYPPISGADLADCIAAARVRRLPDDADYRTPWERGDDAALVAYEQDQLRRSVDNMTALGLMGRTST